MPKPHVIDSGLAARLLRLTADKLGQRNPTALQQFGHLLETFVVGETLNQVSWMDGIAGVGHWRTHDSAEVDLVIERDGGSVVAGVVMHTGARSYNADDRIAVLPIGRLWTASR